MWALGPTPQLTRYASPGPAGCHRPDGAHSEGLRGPAECQQSRPGGGSAPVASATRPPAFPTKRHFYLEETSLRVTWTAPHLEGKGTASLSSPRLLFPFIFLVISLLSFILILFKIISPFPLYFSEDRVHQRDQL